MVPDFTSIKDMSGEMYSIVCDAVKSSFTLLDPESTPPRINSLHDFCIRLKPFLPADIQNLLEDDEDGDRQMHFSSNSLEIEMPDNKEQV